jgi:hypothetical protein
MSKDVRYWSDFNRLFYHPRSIVQLNEYELNSQLMPFETWAAGEDLFQSLDKEFDLLDRDVRFFAEECDQMQGFQLFATADDAWGGFAARYLDSLRDEYGKTSIWVWGVEDESRATRVSFVWSSPNSSRSKETAEADVANRECCSVALIDRSASVGICATCYTPSGPTAICEPRSQLRLE